MNGKKIFALSRIGAALIAAVILLACSGWAFIYLIGLPKTVTQGAELTDGAYVTTEARYLMDICGRERVADSDEVIAYYAIAPVGDQFVILRFPAAEYDTIADFEAETQAYLYGEQASVPYRMSVTGMVRGLDEDTAALLSAWFSNNAGWMSQSGLIAAVEDYGTYLSGYMIDTGSTGAVGTSAAIIMTVIAAALIVYTAVEIVLLCVRKPAEKGKRYKGVNDG